MADSTARDRRPGRPREDRATSAAIAATLDLVAENGIGGMTTDAVAARAGVSKATMYRRWPSKDALLVDAVGSLVSEIAVPDTGTLREDVRLLLRRAVRLYADSRPEKLIPELVSEMRRNPDLADAVRSGFLAQRRAALAEILERARARGELRDDIDRELALDLLGGVIYYRFLITGGPLDDALADSLTEALLHGIAVPSPRNTRKGSR
ncbi:MAG TPA: TetR/AcrR family transcriptional regulator [Thermoleophilaceae bacterium]